MKLAHLRYILFIGFVAAGLVVFGQPLLELDTEKVDSTGLRKLYAGPQARQTAKTAAFSNALAAQQTRKLIVVNPTTLDNAVLSLANDVDVTMLKVTPLLLAELRNAGLDSAEAYDCIVADVTPSGEYASRDLKRVGIPDKIKMPKFRYGRKGDVRLAAQSERKVKSIGLNVPTPIFGLEVSEEEFQKAFEKNRQLAMDNGWYTYEYVLPNGDLTTYTDFGELDSQPDLSGADAISEDNGLNAGIVISDWSGKFGNYNVEPLTSDAKTSMMAGAQKWMDALSMKVSVIAKVGFTGDYGSGSRTLGSSWSPDTYTDTSVGIAYPAALIDQLRGQDMHPSANYDIRVFYNKNFSFYYGASTSCPNGQCDFQSIVTHELCHGLGFSSYHYRGSTGNSPDGTWSIYGNVPSIFDTFLYYSAGRLPSLSQSLRRTAFTSNALYWDGSNAKSANGGNRIKMYAPTTYESGSSVSHWDSSVTFTTFMKSSISSGVALRDIDSRLLGAFKDMGWTLKGDVPALAAPVNDNFANATAISGTSGTTSGSNEESTSQAAEPLIGYRSSATTTVWWKWNAPSSGSVQVDTMGTLFDTVLGIYTGSSVTALAKVTEDDDSGGNNTSKCTFSCTSGTTYYICVAGYGGKTGTIQLNWSLTPTYSVAYKPGTYGMGSQQTATKTKGVALTLKGAIFTRTGYTQTGWSKNTSGSTKDYSLDASYTTDAAVTLYPYWTANTYSVYYSLGGGSHGTTHPTSATYDTAFSVSAPTRSGYTFAGWSVTSGLNTSTAKWGTSSSPAMAISSSSTKCVNGATGNVYFKNLTATSGGSVTLTANWTANATISLATALDTTLSFTTGGNASWFGQTAVTHDGVDAAQSGKITGNQSSWMQTTVTGPGIISFWWYASSEGGICDYLEFLDGTIQLGTIGGTSASWTKCSYLIGSGSHALRWNYVKDGSVDSGLDAGFVDQVEWTDNVVTKVEDLGIGFVSGGGIYALQLKNGREVAFYDSWLTDAGISTSGGITASLMNAIGRNGLPRYQSYLFGLEPESAIPAEEQLQPTIAFDANGTPIISCIPKMDNDLVTYTTLGKPSLNSSEWVEVTPGNKASMKFFKVKVELAK